MDVSAQLAAIEQAFAENRLQDVIAQSESFISSNPDRLEGYMYAGRAYRAHQNWSDAEYYMVQANRRDEANIEVLANLALIYLESNNIPAATHHYTLILKKDPNNAVALTGKGDCYFADGIWRYAKEQYTAALDNGAKSQVMASDYAVIVFKLGQCFIELSEYEAGLAAFNQYLPTEFNEALILQKRAFCQALGKDKMDEYAACTELLHENLPNSPQYILELADLANTAGDKAKMGRLYTKLINLSSLSADQKQEAHFGRAMVLVEMGKFPEALSDYNHIISSGGTSWVFYEQRALIKEKLQDWKGVMEDITQALSQQNPQQSNTLLIRGRTLLKANATDKAIADFEKAIKNDPHNANAYYELGMAYNKKGDMAESFRYLVEAEAHGHIKSREMLQAKFAKQWLAQREKNSAALAKNFEGAAARNSQSPILQQAFGKLWLPDMESNIAAMGDDLFLLNKATTTKMLDEMAAEMLLLSPDAILYFEDANAEPQELYYKVVIESEDAIILEAQHTKGGEPYQMRISFFEGSLLFTNVLQAGEVQPLYFTAAASVNTAHKARLTTKKIEGAKYLPSLEALIAGF